MTFAPLYNEKTIKKQFEKIELTRMHRVISKEWIGKIKNKELEKEVENYDVFKETIIINLLGYPREQIKFEVKDVEFSVTDKEGTTHVVFEAKGTKTKDLFARQNYGKREQEHPVIQTVSDMQRFAPPASYGVCTNYRDFVLLDRELGITKCHKFDFLNIEHNDEKLKEFLGIFSYKNLVKEKSLEILYEKSITAEKDFTKEFYKLFHETRLMLIREFKKDKKDVSNEDSIYFTQLFLNRIIFIFFAEDKGYVPDGQLFAKRVFGVLESDQLIDISRRVFDVIAELFVAFDIGSSKLGVFGFNGGLFSGILPQKIYFSDLKEPSFFADLRQNSSLLKTTKLNEKAQKIISKFGNQLNPIISNLLVMESFDFKTEVNVNILGHIFEQSISDIEKLREGKITRRKKEGVFYTPEYITDHICRNTIIPYLSKSDISTVEELIQEYKGSIEELENKLKNIKILDPACGSGAFLNKSVDILLEIHKEVWHIKNLTGKFTSGKNSTIEKWNVEEEIRRIVESNIYGVDINRESVDITRLSLFLKLASENRKLGGLSKNIIRGNSLISEKSIDVLGFNWEDAFPDVIHKKFAGFDGFDIIIGNPPYVSQKGTTDDPNIEYADREYYRKTYKTLSDEELSTRGGVKLNLFALWIEKSINLLKPKGILGFIVHKNILKVESYKFLRRFILDNIRIREIFDLGPGIFDDVTAETTIINLVKEKKKLNIVAAKENIDLSKHAYNSWEINQDTFYDTTDYMFNIYRDEEFVNIEKKMTEKADSLEKCYNIISFGLNTKDNKKYFQPNRIDPSWKKAVMGRNIGKWVVKSFGYVFYNSSVLTRDGDIEAFKENEKLILQRIGTDLIAAYDDENLFCYNSTNMITKLKKEFGLKYLLCLLNSRLINYYYVIAFSMKAKLTVNITQGYISQIPIKKISNDEQKPFEKASDLMIKYVKELNSEKKMFADIMSSKFNVDKLTKKLEDFYKMDFTEFVSEIKDSFKISYNVSKQEEIQKFFEIHKQKFENISKKINAADDEMNELVYTLYGISKNEKKRIEEFRNERILRA